jgi:hypothetical protein
MNGKQNRNRLLQIVSSYGAASARWPEGHAAALRQDAELDLALAREAALDHILDADADRRDLPPALRARILAAAPAAPVRRRFGSIIFAAPPRWVRAAAVATTLAAGAAAGFAGAAAAFTAPGPESSLLDLALSAPGDPFGAFAEDDA